MELREAMGEAADPGQGYRLLKDGEEIGEWDEFLYMGSWHAVHASIGSIFTPHHNPTRRLDPAPEAARGEGDVKSARWKILHAENRDGWLHIFYEVHGKRLSRIVGFPYDDMTEEYARRINAPQAAPAAPTAKPEGT